MPVLAEMLPAGFENPAEMWTAENIGHACRIGAELGVDFVKTTYSGDVETFRRIVEQVYVPIIVLGGTKSEDPRDLLESIHGAIQAGASGVACGRNICQCDEPVKMAMAVAAIIHDGASVEAALDILEQ
jgi:class I fructose-bisphosphate aldolase